MMRGYIVLLALLVYGVFSAEEVQKKTVMEGASVTLNSGVTKQQRDKMLWYFNDILIAYINGEASKNCLYDGEGGRFRDRLDVDNESGSLTITDIRSEHAGRYEAALIRSNSTGTSTSLNRTHKCDSTTITRKTSNGTDIIKTFSVTVSDSQMDIKETDKTVPGSGLSAGAVAGIVVGVALLVFAVFGVIYYRHRISRKPVVKANGKTMKKELLEKV